ncbi:MAG TPA: penicillin-binding protein 1C [Candidatus Baltobacteraceae bacterium]|jgi:penicillin-binding protein 1C|nr:penicillin-binding protein 1C [Candidatus Baltobacteraceae bacterium]
MRALRIVFAVTVVVNAAFAAPYAFAVTPDEIRPHEGSVTFEDRSGIPMGTVLSSSQERTAAVPLGEVSPWFLNALIAAEDRRFYNHAGIDWTAALRSSIKAVRCLCNAGGASTIDMQLARMRFTLPGGVRGKIAQAWDAERIDAGSGKAQILEAYVNRVSMGGNVYGVEAAARDYFGIPASDLDLAQAALLAGIPNDPPALEPRTHWHTARARQRYVLERMVADGMISPAAARVAAQESIAVRPQSRELAGAQQLLFRLAATGSAPRVRTTIDLPLQRFVQAQAQNVVGALAGRNVTQAAALVIDNRSGDVLAYLGSLDYFDGAYLGSNDGVQSLRQPGSTLKPFLYEYALERGVIGAGSILADVPTSYAIPGAQMYSPEDYSTRFAGPVTVRAALAGSLNVPAVRVLSKTGVAPFLDRLRALGFTRLRRSPDYYGLGLTLGAGEVTLWDLAHAYVTLARGGNAIPVRAVQSDDPPPGVQIGSRDDWLLVTDILADRYARAHSFGLHSVLDMPFDAAVKTGTSSGYRDTWTVGFTSEYTVAVWAGNFSGAPMQRISGVDGAGPLWNRIMLHLYERRDPPPFAAPPKKLLADSRRAAPTDAASGSIFNEWRARQEATSGALRILFPQDGAVFEDALAADDPRRASQAIAFAVSHPAGTRVRWTLNGAPLPGPASDTYYWPVRVGRWRLTVSAAGSQTQSVAFAVIPRPYHAPRGFVSGP